MKVEAAVLGSSSLTVLLAPVDVKAALNLNLSHFQQQEGKMEKA